jgi:RimJ/RimL family protein N-acetyltransferase
VIAIPGFRTARLRLRAFTEADLDAYAAMCADPEVMRYLGTGDTVDRDGAWRQMALFLGHWALRGHGLWAVERRDDGRFIGRVGFLSPEGWPGVELAWTLVRDAWGHGYAHEAASAALGFGRTQLGLGPLISMIRPANTPSKRLAERLGAVDAGVIDFMGGPAHLYRHPDG